MSTPFIRACYEIITRASAADYAATVRSSRAALVVAGRWSELRND